MPWSFTDLEIGPEKGAETSQVAISGKLHGFQMFSESQIWHRFHSFFPWSGRGLLSFPLSFPGPGGWMNRVDFRAAFWTDDFSASCHPKKQQQQLIQRYQK